MQRTPSLLLVYGSLLFALLCQLFPWAGQGIGLRPDFMLVVLLYWLFRAPYLCNIGTAWLMGVLVDLATGSLLGQHALAFTFAAYLALIFQRGLALFSAPKILVITFALLVFTRFVVLILKFIAGNMMSSWHYFWPAVTGILFFLVLTLVFGAIAYQKSSKAD
ncbi:MAG: rod shape-determining protein MreD [Methylophilaceae bacterium]|jgi:rod shape-determining protein MreD